MNVIALDGPSGSGKSTISRHLAERLLLPYLDTGAMYRAVALHASSLGVDLTDGDLVAKAIDDMQLDMTNEPPSSEQRQRVIVNGQDITSAIRSKEISQVSSAIAVHPQVRERLVARQRAWVEQHGGGVVEGRDIASVVFPNATLKVFLTASEEERARRRQNDTHAPEFAQLSREQTEKEMAERDKRDSTRKASPLQAVEGSFVVDTSEKSVDEVIQIIFDEFEARAGK